jgi:hypothetical protein
MELLAGVIIGIAVVVVPSLIFFAVLAINAPFDPNEKFEIRNQKWE